MCFLPSLKMYLNQWSLDSAFCTEVEGWVLECVLPHPHLVLFKKQSNVIDLFTLNNWEKRHVLQRARGRQLTHSHGVHNTGSTRFPCVSGDSNLPISVSQRQAAKALNGTGWLNQVTMTNSIFSSFSKDCFSVLKGIAHKRKQTHKGVGVEPCFLPAKAEP